MIVFFQKLVTVKDEIESKLLDSEDKDVIQWCVNALKEKQQDENLKWIQTLLCETAFVRLGRFSNQKCFLILDTPELCSSVPFQPNPDVKMQMCKNSEFDK